jgi:chromatin remodeling complex protein RSC6
MANKKVSKPTTVVSTTKVSEEVSKEKVSSSTKKALNKKTEVVEEEVLVEDVEGESSGEKKKRVNPTRESVIVSFDEIIQLVESEIGILRDSSTKTKGVKFLRILNKKLKALKGQVSRIKQRSSAKAVSSNPNNTNSGFLKPVKISSDMAKFTGWNPEELKSRVEVTKFLCNYIRENNLQNPTDKRQIIPDAKLSKLIKFDSKKENEPLRYYSLQKFLKPHFMKVETV